MDTAAAATFIKRYFYELFEKRNLEALDTYFDEDYVDDDIGDPRVDQKQNAKLFLTDLFIARPTVGVDVVDVLAHNEVIAAFLEWFEKDEERKHIFSRGVALFVVRNNKLLRRHTFVYYAEKK